MEGNRCSLKVYFHLDKHIFIKLPPRLHGVHPGGKFGGKFDFLHFYDIFSSKILPPRSGLSQKKKLFDRRKVLNIPKMLETLKTC